MSETEFPMECPKCGKNHWKLKYEGDCEARRCDKIEYVGTYLGVYGTVTIQCLTRDCKKTFEINVGSD